MLRSCSGTFTCHAGDKNNKWTTVFNDQLLFNMNDCGCQRESSAALLVLTCTLWEQTQSFRFYDVFNIAALYSVGMCVCGGGTLACLPSLHKSITVKLSLSSCWPWRFWNRPLHLWNVKATCPAEECVAKCHLGRPDSDADQYQGHNKKLRLPEIIILDKSGTSSMSTTPFTVPVTSSQTW